MHQFAVCVFFSDGVTEHDLLFDRYSTFNIENILPSNLTSNFKDTKFKLKCVRKNPIIHNPMFLIVDTSHLIKTIVIFLEISSLNKLKINM